MKQLSKALAVFINLCNYGVGIAVAMILIFKSDFTSIFYVNGMTTNESLFFNMLLFEAGLAALGVVIVLMTREYKKLTLVIEYPIIFEVLPVAVSVVSIVYGLRADTSREKIFVIAAAVAYALLSLVVIYAGTTVFQIFPKEDK
ncbi:MAG: hypothetical protein II744_07005 [Eubacterium sp.]|nr:hypothetical protein [Eubacterium sp.]MBR6393148.1 hypothetical protein [Eubacterium sp.]MBR7072224.1 hypothetical protein [Eubacterium sp.]